MNSAPRQVFHRNGNGTYRFTQNFGSSFGGAIAAGDIDGDTDQDVIIGLIGNIQDPLVNKLSIFAGNNSGNFPLAGVGYGGTTGVTETALGDLNGDGNRFECGREICKHIYGYLGRLIDRFSL